jgi:hypothetical protein
LTNHPRQRDVRKSYVLVSTANIAMISCKPPLRQRLILPIFYGGPNHGLEMSPFLI